MTCIKCGSELLREQSCEMTGDFRGESVTVSVNAQPCPRCDYRFIDGREYGAFGKRAADAFRRKHGLLTSGDLKRARRRLGMTQRAFADYVGIGIASLKRWERGLIQSDLMDQMVRIKTDPAAAEQALQELYTLLATAAGPGVAEPVREPIPASVRSRVRTRLTPPAVVFGALAGEAA